MSAALIIGGVVLFFVAVAGAFYTFFRQAKNVSPSGQGTTVTTGGDPFLPSNENSKQPTAPQASDFAWVDRNDRKGEQGLEFGVTYLDGGKWLPTIGKHSSLIFKPGKEYSFMVTGVIYDSRTHGGLNGWGYAVHLMPPNHEAMKIKEGKANVAGAFTFTFNVKPAAGGTYRLRIAAGDAADEDAIYFVTPANIGFDASIGV